MAIETGADKWISKGNDYYILGKYDEAIKCFDKAIKKDPNSDGAWYNKGLALVYLEKNNDAIKYFDKVIEKDPNYPDAWIGKGVSLNGLKKYDEAIKCFDKAIEIDPNYSLAWFNKGIVFLNVRKYDEAIKCYDKAIEKDPNYKWAWNYKGLVLYKLGNYAEAIKCYDKAIEKDPNYVEAWSNRGNVLQMIGNYSDAEICYDEAIKMDPKNIDALEGLRYIYSDFKHEYDKALQLSKMVLEIKPDFDAKASMAENLIKVGRYKKGRKCALQVLTETHNALNKCILRLLILSSYLLEDDLANGSKECAKFLDFYRNLNEDFKIGEEQWNFGGMINVISKSNTNLQTKFLLLTLIDIVQGKIDKHKLSFLSEVGSM